MYCTVHGTNNVPDCPECNEGNPDFRRNLEDAERDEREQHAALDAAAKKEGVDLSKAKTVKDKSDAIEKARKK